MAAGYIPTSPLNTLYSNTTAGTVASPDAIDGAVQAIVTTVNDNYDAAVTINTSLSTHKNTVVLDHPDQSVTTVKIKDANVTTSKLADAAVTTAKLVDLAVTREKITLGAVGSSQLDGTLLINYGDIATQAEFAQRGINVKWYGAVGNGVTDDTAAIQAAIDAAPPGGIVFFPVGDYFLSGSGSQLLLITEPVRLEGCGMYSKLVIASSVPSTTDVIRISPSTSFYKELSGIEGLHIIPQSGTPARRAVHFDLTNAGQYISKFTLRNNYIRQLGGHGLYLTNPTNVDGFFTSVIEDNLIYGGSFWQRIGDSVKFTRNTFTGTNVGIEISSVSGAAMVVIDKNNLTAAGGAVKIDSGAQVKILYNQIEQVAAYTGTVDAMIYIGNPTMAEVHGNNMNAHSNVAHCIRVNAAYRAKISKNNMIKGTAESIRVDSGSNKTDIHYDNYYVNSTDTAEIAPSILDNGVGTIGVAKTLTLANGYTADDPTNYNTPSVIKDSNGFVHFLGKIVPGTRTAGTVFTTLPVGFRPLKALSVNIGYRNFTTAKTEIMTLIIASTGTVAVESALDTARLDLDGLSFPVSY